MYRGGSVFEAYLVSDVVAFVGGECGVVLLELVKINIFPVLPGKCNDVGCLSPVLQAGQFPKETLMMGLCLR